MKNFLTILTLASLTSSASFAVDTVAIKQGTLAPMDGILFSHDKSVEVANTYAERDLFKRNNESCNSRSDLQNKIIDEVTKQNAALSEQARSTDTYTTIKIVTTVVLTLATVYVAKKASE